METYTAHINKSYTDIRYAIRQFDALPNETPKEVKEAIWLGLVHALNLVQNELHNLSH